MIEIGEGLHQRQKVSLSCFNIVLNQVTKVAKREREREVVVCSVSVDNLNLSMHLIPFYSCQNSLMEILTVNHFLMLTVRKRRTSI